MPQAQRPQRHDKRERHKAGRDARRAALEAARRRQQNRKRAIAGVIALALIIGLVSLVAGTGDDGTDVATDTTTTTEAAASGEATYGTTACPSEEGEDERTTTFDDSFEKCIDESTDYRAVIEFDNGTVEVDLAEKESPVTVNNFVSLARHRFYEDVVCHRAIKGFMAQCGDPEGTGSGGPGYTIGEEPPKSGKYEIGQLAMAKTAAPGSTGSQFFLITGPQGAALPPDYSLLGTITAGLDVAKAIEADGSEGDPAPPVKVHKILKIRIEER